LNILHNRNTAKMVESNNQFEHGHVDSSILGLLGCDNSFVKRLE